MDSWFWVVACGGIVYLVLSVAVWTQKRRDEVVLRAYEGHVVEKEHQQLTLPAGVSHNYWLRICRDDGRVERILVDRSIYESLEVGDRVVKAAGKRWPMRRTARE